MTSEPPRAELRRHVDIFGVGFCKKDSPCLDRRVVDHVDADWVHCGGGIGRESSLVQLGTSLPL